MGLPLATAVVWVAFGIAIGVLAVSVVVQLDTRRGGVQRLFDLLVTATGGTLLGVSVAFGGTPDVAGGRSDAETAAEILPSTSRRRRPQRWSAWT
jgi:hypothetical protein